MLLDVFPGELTTAGLIIIRRYEAWGRANTYYFACFAAGFLVAVSFLHLVPEALSLVASTPAYLIAGYFFMHVVNWFVTSFVCDKPEMADYALGLVPLLGIGFHSFIDGVIYSVTFKVSVFMGALAAIGMVLDEFPKGIVTYLLTLCSQKSRVVSLRRDCYPSRTFTTM